MAARQSNGRASAVNPTKFELDLLNLAEAGICVTVRHDIGAVEVLIRDHDRHEQILLAAPQAIVLAQRLIATALLLCAGDDQ
jgi:hypothetical protein